MGKVETVNKVNYLRVSVTDRCNLRCTYCMPPGGVMPKGREELLTFEEILKIVNIFSSLGISKVRITGGEPLARRDVSRLIELINDIEGVKELLLTTNGMLLSRYADALKRAGLRRINVSLDTLRPERFKKISRLYGLYDVLKGIDSAIAAGFEDIRINMVVMKGINDDEIDDFIGFAFSKKIILRFIEFMKVTPLWDKSYFMPIENVRDRCDSKYNLIKKEKCVSGPAHYYDVEGRGRIGFIKTTSENCMQCSRLRLTSTGNLKLCLYEKEGYSLRDLLRSGADDDEIRYILSNMINRKPEISYKSYKYHNVYMSTVGG